MNEQILFKIESHEKPVILPPVPVKGLELDSPYSLNVALASPYPPDESLALVIPVYLTKVHPKLFATEVKFWQTDEQESTVSSEISWYFSKAGLFNRRFSGRPEVSVEIDAQRHRVAVFGAHFSNRDNTGDSTR